MAIEQNGETEATEKSGRSGALPWIGEGHYRTTIELPKAVGYAELLFDGAMAEPVVKVNGAVAGEWKYGYNAFRVDITPYVKEGANLVEVDLRNLEESSRWYPPLPGDRVVFTVDSKGAGYLKEILPRVNELVRPAVSNVDALLIVVSATEPLPDLELADKLLLYCAKQGIRPVLVINKCDGGENGAAREIFAQYEKALDDIITVSAETGFGMDELQKQLSGQTVCLAGQSAVGKSSLINALLGLELETGELSAKTERGRHTTRHAQLIKTPEGGLVADTPGFSMLESVPLEPEEIPRMYPEFKEYEGCCRFIGCMHISEPDCAVKQALSEGVIDKERYARYVKIANEALEARRHRYD